MDLKKGARRAFKSIVLVGVLALTVGCTMYGIVKVSEPVLSDTSNGNITLKDDILIYPDLTVSVKPQNYYVSFFSVGPVVPIVPIPTVGDPKIKRQGLELMLVVQMDTESDGYTFAPGDVHVLYNGNKYNAADARGPYVGGEPAREVQRAVPGHKWECDRSKYLLDTLQPRAVKGKVCFDIEFPLDTPKPQEEFQVILGGISRNGLQLVAPTLKFRPASRGGLTLMIE